LYREPPTDDYRARKKRAGRKGGGREGIIKQVSMATTKNKIVHAPSTKEGRRKGGREAPRAYFCGRGTSCTRTEGEREGGKLKQKGECAPETPPSIINCPF